MISDKKFIENYLRTKSSTPPENEEDFKKAGKLEQAFSAIGGALLTYAAAKNLQSKNSNTWVDYAVSILGGALVVRGIWTNIKKKKEEG